MRSPGTRHRRTAPGSGQTRPTIVPGPLGAQPSEPATRWFLSREERGNPGTELDRQGPEQFAWTEGNLVTPLVEGATYFERLYQELSALRPGDRVYFTDWRGDADQRLRAEGPTIGELLCTLVESGVELRGLVWRSHSDRLSFSARENERLGAELNRAGAQVMLDQRVRTFGSHHQKLFLIQHRGDPARDVGFVGGIDLCHGRRDDCRHQGDPQQQQMDVRYGSRAPWHDAAVELRGPVLAELLLTFAERWNDPHPLDRRTPYHWLAQRRAHMPRHPPPLPDHFPPPPPAGDHPVQVVRTYGRKHAAYPFAPGGERSVARAMLKAFGQARSLIYIEDQYLWSPEIVAGIAEALRRSDRLCFIAVLPRFPDEDDRLNGPPNRLGQLRALQRLRAIAPGRVGVFDLENAEGTPIYIHAKICIVDDEWLSCGSANVNRRSWTTDSELSCTVADAELARGLRRRLWAEHLGLVPVETGAVEPPPAQPQERAKPQSTTLLDRLDVAVTDPAAALAVWRETADALDAWHRGGRHGERPRGQVRRHEPVPVRGRELLWAVPLYTVLFDPDGRPRALRRRNAF